MNETGSNKLKVKCVLGAKVDVNEFKRAGLEIIQMLFRHDYVIVFYKQIPKRLRLV